jgi:hypothetical protein
VEEKETNEQVNEVTTEEIVATEVQEENAEVAEVQKTEKKGNNRTARSFAKSSRFSTSFC